MKYASDLRNIFIEMLANEEFVVDKSGVKMLELLGTSFIIDTSAVFGEVNYDYVKKEIAWYNSLSRNVYDMSSTPAIWKLVADKDGNINSNYGWCIYSEHNFNQYKNCLRELRKNKFSRRGVMIYTRPSIQTEYNINGMNDFICTNAVNYYIRNDKLHVVVQMRSNDLIYGYKNDVEWQKEVQRKLVNDLKDDYKDLQIGDIIWNAGSLHIYERHFNLVK